QSRAKCSSKSTGLARAQNDPHSLHVPEQWPFTEGPLLKKFETPAGGRPEQILENSWLENFQLENFQLENFQLESIQLENFHLERHNLEDSH
ncbi:2991_t:CDS:1, partial [Gigaspora rosea]